MAGAVIDRTGPAAHLSGMMAIPPDRRRRRFDRQLREMARQSPRLGGLFAILSRRRWFLVRLPLAILFILGGVLSVLPILGLWMLPVGLLLLAVDLPVLQGPLSVASIRLRRWIDLRRQRRRHRG